MLEALSDKISNLETELFPNNTYLYKSALLINNSSQETEGIRPPFFIFDSSI